MNMFERLVAVAEREGMTEETVLADPVTLRRLKARRVVRAVLAELHDPTDAMLAAGFAAQGVPVSIRAIWRAMVDAAAKEDGP